MTHEQALLAEASDDRLARTHTFRDGGWDLWRAAEIHVVGAGNLGQRVAMESALSGAHVTVYDFDVHDARNACTQRGVDQMPKVEFLERIAAEQAGGRLVGIARDIRHVGIGRLSRARVLIDCTDDPQLAVPLTRISNGLGIPLLRAALAGDGQRELGRVACSHGGGDHACQLCTYAIEDLARAAPRVPCRGDLPPTAPPTLAGGALGAMIAGVAVLQAQRLVAGNDLERVLNREWIVDLDEGRILPLVRQRSADCLSGHVRWQLESVELKPEQTMLADLFALASERLAPCDADEVTLEPHGHPLYREVACRCGHYRGRLGTEWSIRESCDHCGGILVPTLAAACDRLTARLAAELGALHIPLTQLGFPDDGPLFTARVPKKKPLRLVLATEPAACGMACDDQADQEPLR